MSYEEFIITKNPKKGLTQSQKTRPYESPPAKRQNLSLEPKITINYKIANQLTLQQLQELNPQTEAFSHKLRYLVFSDGQKYLVYPPYTIRKYYDETTNQFIWYAIQPNTKISGGTGYVKQISVFDPKLAFDEQDFSEPLKEKTYKIPCSETHQSLRNAFCNSYQYESYLLQKNASYKIETKKQTQGLTQKCRIVSLWHEGTSLQSLLNDRQFLKNDAAILYDIILSTAQTLAEINITAVHLDVKPGNILIQKQRAYKFIDGDSYFQLANDPASITSIRTTSTYSAPELAAGNFLTANFTRDNLLKFDGFALGVTFLITIGFSEEVIATRKKTILGNLAQIPPSYQLFNTLEIRDKILENFQTTIEIATAICTKIGGLLTINPIYRITAKDAASNLDNLSSLFNKSTAITEENLASPVIRPHST